MLEPPDQHLFSAFEQTTNSANLVKQLKKEAEELVSNINQSSHQKTFNSDALVDLDTVALRMKYGQAIMEKQQCFGFTVYGYEMATSKVSSCNKDD